MDDANQRLETGYEPIHVNLWRPDLRLNGEAIYTKKFTEPLLGTCKLNGVEPEAWLRDVISKIRDWPSNRVYELLPWNLSIVK